MTMKRKLLLRKFSGIGVETPTYFGGN